MHNKKLLLFLCIFSSIVKAITQKEFLENELATTRKSIAESSNWQHILAQDLIRVVNQEMTEEQLNQLHKAEKKEAELFLVECVRFSPEKKEECKQAIEFYQKLQDLRHDQLQASLNASQQAQSEYEADAKKYSISPIWKNSIGRAVDLSFYPHALDIKAITTWDQQHINQLIADLESFDREREVRKMLFRAYRSGLTVAECDALLDKLEENLTTLQTKCKRYCDEATHKKLVALLADIAQFMRNESMAISGRVLRPL